MPVEDNKQAVRRFYQDVINGRNLDALEELLTPDGVDHTFGSQSPEQATFTVSEVMRSTAAVRPNTGIRGRPWVRCEGAGQTTLFELTREAEPADFVADQRCIWAG
jgi:ketosteroid isomerase-like protein